MSLIGIRIELEASLLNEISQTQKDKYCIFSLLCRTMLHIDIYNHIHIKTEGILLKGREETSRRAKWKGDGEMSGLGK